MRELIRRAMDSRREFEQSRQVFPDDEAVNREWMDKFSNPTCREAGHKFSNSQILFVDTD